MIVIGRCVGTFDAREARGDGILLKSPTSDRGCYDLVYVRLPVAMLLGGRDSEFVGRNIAVRCSGFRKDSRFENIFEAVSTEVADVEGATRFLGGNGNAPS